MNDHYTPDNRIEFYDHNSNRQMMLTDYHSGGLWLFYEHPDGQWVSLVKPVFEDIKHIMDIRVKESQHDARAAGFAEGIEAAAKHLESFGILSMKQVVQEIRGLLPKEPADANPARS